MSRLRLALPLLLAAQLLAACASIETVELDPSVTGRQWSRNVVAPGDRFGCLDPFAPIVAGEREDGLRAGYEQEDHSNENCGYYVNDLYQTLLLFDMEIAGATLVQSARLEIDTRNAVRGDGAWRDRCMMFVGRATESWPFGYSFGSGEDSTIGSTSDLLIVDGFARDAHQSLDVTRLVRPQLNGDNKGLVISPHRSLLTREAVPASDQEDCYTIVSNPRLVLELVVPD